MTAYNGWTNYETWCVSLWMSNDQGSYEYYRELARYFYKDKNKESPTYALAKQLQKLIVADMPDNISDAINGTMYSDLLGAALSEVNWQEIAEHLLEDINDEK